MSEPSEHKPGDPAHAVIAAEHRHLGTLFEEVRAALEQPADDRTARAALDELREGMEAHFQREESLYYPTIWALRPDLKESLTGLVDTHPQFRERLGEFAAALAGAATADADRSFAELVELFSDHERAEELLLDSLDVELTSSA